MAGVGHNSGEEADNGSIATKELRLFVERVERLEEEKKGITDDIKEVKAEAKSRGYLMKEFNEVLKIRKMKKGQYEEHCAVMEVYLEALGLI